MARALWSGVVTFGLVSIPVKLFSATENKSIAFHQLHDKCGTRIQEIRWCPECDEEVSWEEVQKGFEYNKGEYIVIEKEDLEALPLPTKDMIEIESFVDLEEIDPVYFQKSYFLESDEKSNKPYDLFIRSLIDKKKVAIAKVALRNKEHLCCLRPVGTTLLLETLYYQDELRIDPNAELTRTKVSKKELDIASHLVDLMSDKFTPEKYNDTYRDALTEVIEAKLHGKKVTKHKAKSEKVVDLMQALKASVSKAGTRTKKPTRRKKAGPRKRRSA